jgi:tricorn protease
MKTFIQTFAVAVLFLGCARNSGASGPLLLQKPTLSQTHIVFVYADELWIVPRSGGEARQLTSGPGTKTNPRFSLDGSMIAYTGDYNGNLDVYVMPSEGGISRRLTHHPALDKVVGWVDSKDVLFSSSRNSYSFFDRLFTVPITGGLPHELPLPMGESASFSPDGKSIAYVPADNYGRLSLIAWKRYRGGKEPRIWIANLPDLGVEEIPHENCNDSSPMWIGNKVYFLSDRNGPVGLFAYDLQTRKVEQALPSNGADIKSASAGPGAIIYEQLGSLNLFDLRTGKSSPVQVTVAADLPAVHPHFKVVKDEIAVARLSPSGVRAVFESHGEILTVPVDKGDIRNLTSTPGTMERDPAWSRDGEHIAYFSDESGEYQLFVKRSDGAGKPQKISLGATPSFYYQPVWSDDGRKIAYTDKRLNLWYVGLEKEQPVKVDTDTYDSLERSFDPVWSSDSKWIAYTKTLVSHFHALFIYSLEEGRSYQVTDGLSDVRFPAFDKNGQYLYFTASTDAGPTTAWLDLSSIDHPVTRAAYMIVLRKDKLSPLVPQSDEEQGMKNIAGRHGETAPAGIGQKDPVKKEPAASRIPAQPQPSGGETAQIDLENISQRILALPVPERNYSRLAVGTFGTIFLVEDSQMSGLDQEPETLWRFDLDSRRTERVTQGIGDFAVSFDGNKLLYRKGGKWVVASASISAASGGGEVTLDLSDMSVLVEPRAEWRQEYNEIWRVERDYFYDPHLHGVKLQETKAQYEPYLENLGSRLDFSYLLSDMLGEFTVGHMIIRTPHDQTRSLGKVGLLGADYVIDNGHYKFGHIYQGENWNPELRAPLTEPGLNLKEGEYLLAVNGRELRGTDEIFELFEGLAGKSVVLTVGDTADGKAVRNVTVVPIADETALRQRAWIDENQRRTNRLSRGSVAYVYLPDTGFGGFTSFNRYFFSQIDRQAVVIDERFNDGGSAADYVIDYLRRSLQNYWLTREGRDFTTPLGAIYGPKAMVVNMFSGSGGDVLPWYFREEHLGPVVGTRTWGGVIGVYDTPSLMDGIMVTAPRVAFYSPKGEWEIENHGVAPDYEIEITPRDWAQGRDPQLEKAVALVLEELAKHSQQAARRPAFPDYHSGRSVLAMESPASSPDDSAQTNKSARHGRRNCK